MDSEVVGITSLTKSNEFNESFKTLIGMSI